MAHIHNIIDGDAHFKIDPITRKITNKDLKITLVQHDHNSDRISFDMPRHIDGHDMMECDKVEIHYLNLATNKKESNPGIYRVTDLDVGAKDDNTLTFSWLVSETATYYAGLLFFAVHFTCTDESSDAYRWSTLVYDNPGITVGEGIHNAEDIPKKYIDVLEEWKKDLYEEIVYLKQNTPSGESALTIAQVEALDGMFKKCAFTGDVTTEYEAFKTAFGIESGGTEEPDTPVEPTATLSSISATYTGGDVAVGTAVNSLTGITVTAHYSDGSTANVTGYTLSGTIAEGNNTITVSYGGKTTTFTVVGIAESGGEDTEPFVNLFNVNLRKTTAEDVAVGVGSYENHYVNTDADIQLTGGVTYYVYTLFDGVSNKCTLFENNGDDTYTTPEYTATKVGVWLSGTYDEFGNEKKESYSVEIDGVSYSLNRFAFTPTEDCSIRFAFNAKCVGHTYPDYNYLFTKEYNPFKDTLE